MVQFPRFYWFLLFPEHPELLTIGRRFIWIAVHAFLVQFIREYLQTRLQTSFWDKLLISSIVFMPAYLLVFFLSFPYSDGLQAVLLYSGTGFTYQLVVFTIALTIIALYRKGYSPARFLLFTLAPFLLIWSVVDFLATLNIITHIALDPHWNAPQSLDYFFFYAEFFTTSRMALFFSSALTRRHTQTRKSLVEQAIARERLGKEREIERGRLIEQQKVELEQQVEQRTAELKHSLQELKATQAQLIQSEKWIP